MLLVFVLYYVVLCYSLIRSTSEQVGAQVSEQVLELYNKVLEFCKESKTAKEISNYLVIS